MFNVRKQIEKQAVKAMYITLKLVPLSLFNTGELMAWDACKRAYGQSDSDMCHIMNKVRKKLGHEQIWGELPPDFEMQKAKAIEENKDQLPLIQEELRKNRR